MLDQQSRLVGGSVRLPGRPQNSRNRIEPLTRLSDVLADVLEFSKALTRGTCFIRRGLKPEHSSGTA